jgi:hypothetical protein
VTTGDREVANTVAQLYGGGVKEWETSREDYLEVLTSADKVLIVIDGPQAIRDRLILWGRNGPIHECDGVYFLSPEEDAGTEFGTCQDRDQGRAPSPLPQACSPHDRTLV